MDKNLKKESLFAAKEVIRGGQKVLIKYLTYKENFRYFCRLFYYLDFSSYSGKFDTP